MSSCNPDDIARCRIFHNFLPKGVCGTKLDSGGVISDYNLSSSTATVKPVIDDLITQANFRLSSQLYINVLEAANE